MQEAIAHGGSTLKDFVGADGKQDISSRPILFMTEPVKFAVFVKEQ